MESIENFFNSMVDSFFKEQPKRNPSIFSHFLDYYKENENLSDLIEKYTLLNTLNTKYNFIRSKQIYVFLEYYVMRDLIENLPNVLISDEEYQTIMEEYDTVLEHKKDRKRLEKTIKFICKIFQSFCTGYQEFNSKYIQIPTALCLGIGRRSMNRNMRRLIYENLNIM